MNKFPYWILTELLLVEGFHHSLFLLRCPSRQLAGFSQHSWIEACKVSSRIKSFTGEPVARSCRSSQPSSCFSELMSDQLEVHHLALGCHTKDLPEIGWTLICLGLRPNHPPWAPKLLSIESSFPPFVTVKMAAKHFKWFLSSRWPKTFKLIIVSAEMPYKKSNT